MPRTDVNVDVDVAALLSLVETHLGRRYDFLDDDVVKNPMEGGEYIIFALADTDRCRHIAVRIPKALPGPFTSARIKAEIEIRRRIDAAQIPRFQPLLVCDATADNPLGRPFLILGWAQGCPLTWSENIPQLEAHRQRLLRAIANTSLDLLQVHETGMPALQWITGKINRKIARAEANKLPFGTIAECEQQKSLIPRYWIPDLDDTPHVLVHGDLSINNIIVNDEFEIVSVIDLGWAEMVPLQFAAEFPRLLAHEPIPTPSGFTWTQKRSARLQKDREFYLQCIKERAEEEGGIASSYYAVLSRTDEQNRYWWYTAASRSDVHQAMSLCDWDPITEINKGFENVSGL